jgi:hypothetical protein
VVNRRRADARDRSGLARRRFTTAGKDGIWTGRESDGMTTPWRSRRSTTALSSLRGLPLGMRIEALITSMA